VESLVILSVPETKDSAATLTIAELYLKQGHYDKAIEVYQELLAEDPQNLLLRQKLSAAVEQQQKHQATSGGVASKIKKDEFTRPPEPLGDSIMEDSRDLKKGQSSAKLRRVDDSKFTSEDILQVMLRGDKDDVVVEEKPKAVPQAPPEMSADETETSPSSPKREAEASLESTPEPQTAVEEPALTSQQLESLKGVLAELAGVEGIRGSFLSGEDGTLLISLGKSGQDASTMGQTAAAIFKGTRQSVQRLSQGRMNQVLITAEEGQILLVETVKGILVVFADEKIKIGLLRLALDTSVKKIEKIFRA
jgi:predicted regulator of Ras-like GTPase activity (Roadblock/LC7/MglB family)